MAHAHRKQRKIRIGLAKPVLQFTEERMDLMKLSPDLLLILRIGRHTHQSTDPHMGQVGDGLIRQQLLTRLRS